MCRGLQRKSMYVYAECDILVSLPVSRPESRIFWSQNGLVTDSRPFRSQKRSQDLVSSLSVCMFMYMCISCIIDEYLLCLSRHNAHCNYSAWFVLLGFVLQLYFPVFVFVLRLYFPVTVFVFVCCVHRTLTAPGCCCSGLRTSLTAGESSGVARLPTPVLCCVPFLFSNSSPLCPLCCVPFSFLSPLLFHFIQPPALRPPLLFKSHPCFLSVISLAPNNWNCNSQNTYKLIESIACRYFRESWLQ